MNQTLIISLLTFVIGVVASYFLFSQVLVGKTFDDWTGALPNVTYIEKTIPDTFDTLRKKYDEGRLISNKGEVIFSYSLHDLNDDGFSEILLCEEDGGFGMDGAVCNIGIYQVDDRGNYIQIYEAMAENLPTVSEEIANSYKVLYQDLGFDSDYRCELQEGVYSCSPE